MNLNRVRIFIRSGAGGLEANCCAALIFGMYRLWAERHEIGVNVSHLMTHPGLEGGMEHGELDLKGYGLSARMCGEAGVHRIVRTSPFDPKKRRHSSFTVVSLSYEDDSRLIRTVPVRSYVFDPYTLVKDMKTGGAETSDIEAVMNGDLSLFIPSA